MRYVLSILTLARNSLEGLRRIGAAIEALPDTLREKVEWIVVDTRVAGEPDDGTIAYVTGRPFAVQRMEFPWCDDFAAARNAGLELANGEWATSFDSDYVPIGLPRLMKALRKLPGDRAGLLIESALPDGAGAESLVQLNLWRTSTGARYVYPIHEQLRCDTWTAESRKRWAAGDTTRLPIPAIVGFRLMHDGYADAAVLAQKRPRNLALLATMPEGDPHRLAHEARTLFGMGQGQEAAKRTEALFARREDAGDANDQDTVFAIERALGPEVYNIHVSALMAVGAIGPAVGCLAEALDRYTDNVDLWLTAVAVGARGLQSSALATRHGIAGSPSGGLHRAGPVLRAVNDLGLYPPISEDLLRQIEGSQPPPEA